MAASEVVLYTRDALELGTYTPALFGIGLGIAFCCLFWALGVFVGPSRTTAEKSIPFECGSEPIGSPRGRYSVKFYQVAILFLVFDIESAFMYPWAVLYHDFGDKTSTLLPGNMAALGFAEMLLFVVVLLVALTYVWRKRAIGWD